MASLRTFIPSKASPTSTIEAAGPAAGISEFQFSTDEIKSQTKTNKRKSLAEKLIESVVGITNSSEGPIQEGVLKKISKAYVGEFGEEEDEDEGETTGTATEGETTDKEGEQFDPTKYDHVDQYYRRKSEVLYKSETQLNNAMVPFEPNNPNAVAAADVEKVKSYAEVYAGSKTAIALYNVEGGIQSAHYKLKTQVTVFEALALSTILDELFLKLDFLGHSFPGQFLKFEETDFLTYDERFALEVSAADLVFMPRLKHFKNPFIIDEAQVGTSETRMAHKLQKDRAFIQEIVRQAKDELDDDRTFEKLKDNVSREDGRRHEEITLYEREKLAKQNVDFLHQRIDDFRDQMLRDEHNRKEMINHLKDQLFQEKQNSKMDARYTRATLDARNTFNFSELSHTVELEQLKTKELEIQMTRDRLANRNIQAWTRLMCNEIEQKIKEWQEKFDKDLEDIDQRIRNKQDSLRTQQMLIEDLNKTIEERMVELGPWEEEKEKERQERIEYLRLYYNARKIQRWWRAFMKKHGLYKKRKGRKGKGKGKGAGGGKKKKARK